MKSGQSPAPAATTGKPAEIGAGIVPEYPWMRQMHRPPASCVIAGSGKTIHDGPAAANHLAAGSREAIAA